MSSKLGRPLGRPRWRASLLGDSGTSPERGGPVFLLPPAPPPPGTALGCGGLLTLTLRGKAMDGFEEQQDRNRPQLCPPSLGNRRNGCRFPTSVNRPAALRRRGVRSVSLSKTTEHTIDRSQTPVTQSTRPLNRGRFKSCCGHDVAGCATGCSSSAGRVIEARVTAARPAGAAGTRGAVARFACASKRARGRGSTTPSASAATDSSNEKT